MNRFFSLLLIFAFTACYKVPDNTPQAIFSAYPNPCADQLNIQLNTGSGETVDIALFNSTGQQILSTSLLANFDNFIIDLSQEEAGQFFFEVLVGNDVFTEKIIKAK